MIVQIFMLFGLLIGLGITILPSIIFTSWWMDEHLYENDFISVGVPFIAIIFNICVVCVVILNIAYRYLG